MSHHCGLLSGVKVEPLESVLEMATPVGLSMVYDQLVKGFPIMIGELVLPANFVLMSMVEIDIILGMDWLTMYHASVDYFNKEVIS